MRQKLILNPNLGVFRKNFGNAALRFPQNYSPRKGKLELVELDGASTTREQEAPGEGLDAYRVFK